MTRAILIECGAAATRGALLVDGEVIGFAFAPARGDEGALAPLRVGALVAARIAALARPLGGAFLDLGGDGEGFLPIARGSPLPTEGARLIARVRRPAIGAKVATLDADWRAGATEAERKAVESRAREAPLGRFMPPADAACDVARALGVRAGDDVAVDSADAAAALARGGYAARIGARLFHGASADVALETALARTVTLGSGARLIFDETDGAAAIDIDAGSAVKGAGARLADRINLEAAAAIPGELARRRIGGRVVVDFLRPSGAASRAGLKAAFAAAAASRYPCRIGALAADGFLDLVAPRHDRSLLEEASEPADPGDLRPGRRLTCDFALGLAIAALEDQLAARPAARVNLRLGRELADFLAAERPASRARLAARYGARFDIGPDARLPARAHSLDEAPS